MSEQCLKQGISEEYTSIFELGINMVFQKLTLCFNKETLILFIAVILDVRVKCEVYNKRIRNEGLSCMLGE